MHPVEMKGIETMSDSQRIGNLQNIDFDTVTWPLAHKRERDSSTPERLVNEYEKRF